MDQFVSSDPISSIATRLPERGNLRTHSLPGSAEDDLALVAEGLSAPQPWLHPRFFYDTAGSELFDAITQTPEYYPTRTEALIFNAHAGDMLARVPRRQVLVEPGAGNCVKAEQFLQNPELTHYAPIEISGEFLLERCSQLAADHPELMIDAISGDFTRCRKLPDCVPRDGRLIFFPGSTIGNFAPDAALALLENFHALAGAGGHLLIGTDLPKDRKTLEAAYNDSQGLTAQFNLNALAHLNRCFDCQFDVRNFSHRAFYNAALARIEMHLVSQADTRVRVGDQTIPIARGESIHTENSYKYAPEAFLQLAGTAGFEPVARWTDPQQWFAVHLLVAA